MTTAILTETTFTQVCTTLSTLSKAQVPLDAPLEALRASLIAIGSQMVANTTSRKQRNRMLNAAADSLTTELLEAFPDADKSDIDIKEDSWRHLLKHVTCDYLRLLARKGVRVESRKGLYSEMAFINANTSWKELLADGLLTCEWPYILNRGFVERVTDTNGFAEHLTSNATLSGHEFDARIAIHSAIREKDGVAFVLAMLLGLPITIPTHISPDRHAQVEAALSNHSRMGVEMRFGPVEDFLASKPKQRAARSFFTR